MVNKLFSYFVAAGSPILVLLKTNTTDQFKTDQTSILNKMATFASLSFLAGLLLASYFGAHWDGFEGVTITYLLIFFSFILSAGK